MGTVGLFPDRECSLTYVPQYYRWQDPVKTFESFLKNRNPRKRERMQGEQVFLNRAVTFDLNSGQLVSIPDLLKPKRSIISRMLRENWLVTGKDKFQGLSMLHQSNRWQD